MTTTTNNEARSLLAYLAEAAQGYLDAEEAHEEAIAADPSTSGAWGDTNIRRAAALTMLEGALEEAGGFLRPAPEAPAPMLPESLSQPLPESADRAAPTYPEAARIDDVAALSLAGFRVWSYPRQAVFADVVVLPPCTSEEL